MFSKKKTGVQIHSRSHSCVKGFYRVIPLGVFEKTVEEDFFITNP